MAGNPGSLPRFRNCSDSTTESLARPWRRSWFQGGSIPGYPKPTARLRRPPAYLCAEAVLRDSSHAPRDDCSATGGDTSAERKFWRSLECDMRLGAPRPPPAAQPVSCMGCGAGSTWAFALARCNAVERPREMPFRYPFGIAISAPSNGPSRIRLRLADSTASLALSLEAMRLRPLDCPVRCPGIDYVPRREAMALTGSWENRFASPMQMLPAADPARSQPGIPVARRDFRLPAP